MSDDTLSLADLTGGVKRHYRAVLLTVAVCLAATFGAMKVVPPKYKSIAVLNIKNTYFQTPLLDDFVTSAREPGEISAQKEALVRAALNDEFLDQLAANFGIYPPMLDPDQIRKERLALRKRVEFLPTSPTTFQFSVIAKDSGLASRMNEAVLNRVVEKFVGERESALVQYRDSLKRQIGTLGKTIEDAPPTVSKLDLLREELRAVERKIVASQLDYTPSHPAVLALKKKAATLKRDVKAESMAAQPKRAKPKEVRPDLYYDLLKRVHYVDIVLELEKNRKDATYIEVLEKPSVPVTPIFPNPKNFFLLGALASLLFSGLIVGYLELKRASTLTAEAASKSLGLPFFGALPELRGPAKKTFRGN